ncbi:hypothetical protein, conserved [Plasmodium gonderi]|uniref:Cytoplasmic tRNA 2-thiolation protein 1 n=1 Tax=Plasmodium gonderi TaxID=77519 RepID=A0A1Y1JL15_PLAGO|nr:hypothetical protein, conserved [Plasmodium gonderi]GAW81897.1 hypothetical protein, conserved [Plasmodium gonderi]
MMCEECEEEKACMLKPSNRKKLCKKCFIEIFEDEVHDTILKKKMFQDMDKICIAVSGGKDSSVLAHLLVHIKKKYHYKWDLFLLAIDEGIKGYRDDSLKIVYKLQKKYNLPLKVLKFEDIFTYTMDTVVRFIGKKNNCTVCGVFRRQAMEKGALLFNATKLVTGHNADDLAETILMNMCRGDLEKLAKGINQIPNNGQGHTQGEPLCCSGENRMIGEKAVVVGTDTDTTKGDNNTCCRNRKESKKGIIMDCDEPIDDHPFFIPRLKPLMWSYEKEIVLYAFHLKLDYFSTECTYSPNSFRGNLRSFIKDIEMINPQFILNIIHSAEFFYHNSNNKKILQVCEECGAYTSNKVCKACLIVKGLRTYKDNSFLYANKKKKEKNRIPIRYD